MNLADLKRECALFHEELADLHEQLRQSRRGLVDAQARCDEALGWGLVVCEASRLLARQRDGARRALHDLDDRLSNFDRVNRVLRADLAAAGAAIVDEQDRADATLDDGKRHFADLLDVRRDDALLDVVAYLSITDRMLIVVPRRG